ncbi:MAG TPA: rod shape-determining protein MreC [Acidobacteriota bacterium]|nr:rod shape-determining protein MreC [Acidobacteriota bacterium]
MKWISGTLSRHWRNVHFIAVIVLSALLTFGSQRFNGYVSQTALVVFYQPFAKIKRSVEELSAVNAENHRLRQSLVEASLRLSELEEMKLENIRLRSVLGFEPPPGYKLLPARVLSVSGERMPVSAVINRGYHDSVFVDQTLINQEGLIGRIVAVMPDNATVQLLTDPANRTAVRVTSSREMGIVKYVASEGMILDNFPIQGQISEGELVISSGLGGIYPAGLVVGTVASIRRPEDEPFCKVRLTPAANFSSLEELFILRPDMR